jgi:hypothetical protein
VPDIAWRSADPMFEVEWRSLRLEIDEVAEERTSQVLPFLVLLRAHEAFGRVFVSPPK